MPIFQSKVMTAKFHSFMMSQHVDYWLLVHNSVKDTNKANSLLYNHLHLFLKHLWVLEANLRSWKHKNWKDHADGLKDGCTDKGNPYNMPTTKYCRSIKIHLNTYDWHDNWAKMSCGRCRAGLPHCILKYRIPWLK